VHKQNWNKASELRVPSGHEINKPTVLFKKVQDEDIRMEREKLQRLTKNIKNEIPERF